MRYLRILSLHFVEVFQDRLKSFIYFLLHIVNPLALILFWNGAKTNTAVIEGFTRSQLNSYYLTVIFVVSFVISHIEENIAKDHIREGNLVRYLTRPFPYLLLQFFEELPHRILQSVFGVMAFYILASLIPSITLPTFSPLAILIIALAYILSFLLQATFSLLAFWIIELSGMLNTLEVIRVVLTGILVPLSFLPESLAAVAYISPFAYLIYFPVITLMNIASFHMQVWIVFMQLLWILIFGITYKIMWYFGVRRFSGVGQ